MTSTSIMSNTSFDEQQNIVIIQISAKHLYGELDDINLFL
jgi:hypothetical protein